MLSHDVRVHPSTDVLKREGQLPWKIAAAVPDKVRVQPDVARCLAMGHPRHGGATITSASST